MSLVEFLYNRCYGGFSLSKEAVQRYVEAKKNMGETLDIEEAYGLRDVERTDPVLINIVKEIGKKANGACADLQIISVPSIYKNNISIDEYDGYESICVDFKGYQIDKIKEIVEGNSDFKMELIKGVLEEELVGFEPL